MNGLLILIGAVSGYVTGMVVDRPDPDDRGYPLYLAGAGALGALTYVGFFT
jgi:hypothetical protein